MTKPLGQWTVPTHQSWTTWCTTDRDFVCVNNAWYRKHTYTRRATYLPTAQNKTQDQPADVIKKNHTIILLGTSPITSNPKHTEPSVTAWGHFHNAPAWQHEIWGNAPITEEVINENSNYIGTTSTQQVMDLLNAEKAHMLGVFFVKIITKFYSKERQ